MDKTGKIALITAVGIVVVFAIAIATAAPPNRECRDGIDNDGDGAVDWPADAGCSKKNDNDESNCGDGVCEGGETASSCAVDCQVCGNNVREGSEVCDGTDLAGETCSSQGFDGGLLGCAGACDAFVTSGCWTNTCADTDGGFVVDVQGTVSGDNSGSPYNNTDTCVNSTKVREWQCSQGAPQSNVVSCVAWNFTGCSNGACV